MKWIRALFTLGLIFFAGEAWAQTCSISVVSAQFGGYIVTDPAPVDATGAVNATCDVGLAYTVRLDPGLNSGGGFFPRKMLHATGGDTIIYNLYRNSALTEVWGDGTNSTFVQSAVGTGSEKAFNVFGRVPALQAVPDGSYNDVVTVTIEW